MKMFDVILTQRLIDLRKEIIELEKKEQTEEIKAKTRELEEGISLLLNYKHPDMEDNNE